uniref:Uncharacterized protein n=1 Tax=Anopheles maculatus TaxID=74869 RepID=A0A182T8A2_9DIPT
MRTKSSAHHISTVIDLTYSQEPPPITSTNQQVKPSGDTKKDAKQVREKNCNTAKVRKAPCSTTAKKPSIKRKRIHQQNAPAQQQQQQPTGLYQFDLTDMIRQKLKMLFEQPMMAAHGSSFIPSDP